MGDVTAGVVFRSLRRGLEGMEGLTVHGPVQQGQFRISMGAVERTVAVMERVGMRENPAEDLYRALERLMNPEEMEERYKVLGIVSGTDRDVPGFQDENNET